MDTANNLRQYFPLIREKEQLLSEIRENRQLRRIFEGWREEQQNEFLDFCTGARGVKLLYDSFFKEIMNPEYDPARMNDFLSQLLKQKVHILKVLPNDSVRISAENTLLITDLVVQLEDGSIANLEIQKIGYLFPGQRAACYSADLLLRQYKRIRSKQKKKFSYKEIKPVYTIVLFEQSPKEFHSFQDVWLHYIEPRSDTGIHLDLLQKYLFIPLDIFKKSFHNKAVTGKTITSKTDAWLTFLCMDSPEDIIRLITDYPEFKPMYEDLYDLCLNTERVMEMFSKELQILDENTVQYMMDEMQDTINEMKGQITDRDNAIIGKDIVIADQNIIIADKDNIITELNSTIQELQKEIVLLKGNTDQAFPS